MQSLITTSGKGVQLLAISMHIAIYGILEFLCIRPSYYQDLPKTATIHQHDQHFSLRNILEDSLLMDLRLWVIYSSPFRSVLNYTQETHVIGASAPTPPIPPSAQYSATLIELILECLARNPHHRPNSVNLYARVLAGLQASNAAAPGPTPVEKFEEWDVADISGPYETPY